MSLYKCDRCGEWDLGEECLCENCAGEIISDFNSSHEKLRDEQKRINELEQQLSEANAAIRWMIEQFEYQEYDNDEIFSIFQNSDIEPAIERALKGK